MVDDMEDSHDGLSYLLRVKLFTNFASLNDVRVISFLRKEEMMNLENSIHAN